MNKKKNINDPLYGFLTLPFDFLLDLVDHPYFQRLRRIRQLGMSHLVFPGANHTRFHHALGALYLMTEAIENLKVKGVDISDDEAEAVCIAILLHDIGHGPFSHALEHSIIDGLKHEAISLAIMEDINRQTNGRLNLAIRIFKGEYHKKFLHQLVSSQLDMDRLDYLRRDSFYSGVTEGIVSSDRIIKMLAVKDDELVVEEKGIYSIEKFIVARRLMYWQVYLHKTVVSAEELLIKILKRARELGSHKEELFATPSFRYFLYSNVNGNAFLSNPDNLAHFTNLDDTDVMASVKVWTKHPDKVLSTLCNNMVKRQLPKILIQKPAFSQEQISEYRRMVRKNYGWKGKELDYFVYTGRLENNAYSLEDKGIQILLKNGKLCDIGDASDTYNLKSLRKIVRKNFLCYYK